MNRNFTFRGIAVSQQEWYFLRLLHKEKSYAPEKYLNNKDSLQYLKDNKLVRDDKGLGTRISRKAKGTWEPQQERINPGTRRPYVNSVLLDEELGEIPIDALNAAADQSFSVNEFMAQKIKDAKWSTELQHPNNAGVIKSAVDTAWAKGPLFHDAFCDWRGRVYYQSGNFGGMLNNKIVRSMLDAPEAHNVGRDSREFRYMLQVIESEYGVNLRNFREVRDSTITNAKDANRVRAAHAIYEVLKHGATAYLMEQDASCSGGQIIALLTGDRALAQVTNAIPAPVRGDIYLGISEDPRMEDLWHMFDLAGPEDKHTRRSMAKPVVMVTFYGGVAVGITTNLWVDLGGATEEVLNTKGELKLEPTGHVTIKGQQYTPDNIAALVKGMVKIFGSKYKGFNKILKWAQKTGAYIENNLDGLYGWDTATGFKAVSPDVTASGFLPNYIHSIDASIVQTALVAAAATMPIYTVHDAFFTTPANALALKDIVIEAYRVVIEDTVLPEDYASVTLDRSLIEELDENAVIGETFAAAAAVAV